MPGSQKAGEELQEETSSLNAALSHQPGLLPCFYAHYINCIHFGNVHENINILKNNIKQGNIKITTKRAHARPTLV